MGALIGRLVRDGGGGRKVAAVSVIVNCRTYGGGTQQIVGTLTLHEK